MRFQSKQCSISFVLHCFFSLKLNKFYSLLKTIAKELNSTAPAKSSSGFSGMTIVKYSLVYQTAFNGHFDSPASSARPESSSSFSVLNFSWANFLARSTRTWEKSVNRSFTAEEFLESCSFFSKSLAILVMF